MAGVSNSSGLSGRISKAIFLLVAYVLLIGEDEIHINTPMHIVLAIYLVDTLLGINHIIK